MKHLEKFEDFKTRKNEEVDIFDFNNIPMSEFQIKAKSPNGVEYIEVKRLMEDYPDFLTMSTAMFVPDINH